MRVWVHDREFVCPQFVFRISGMLRRIWDASLWPVPVERA